MLHVVCYGNANKVITAPITMSLAEHCRRQCDIGTVVAISIHCDVKISLHVVVVLILLVLHQLITMPSKLDTVLVLL